MLIAPNKQNPTAATKHPISDPLPMGAPGGAGLCALSCHLALVVSPLVLQAARAGAAVSSTADSP